MSAKTLENWKAEVMSIGDEIITGQRLDTNTQWISQALGNLGIAVCFHSSVGDDLGDHIHAIQVAMNRADLIVMSGGIGPTADDLTRQAIAESVGVELDFVESEYATIEAFFLRLGRTMPANNRLQAYFPRGSAPIPNPEGTAAGIDFSVSHTDGRCVRIIALPGVPAELKQMWLATVEPRLKKSIDSESLFHHHTLHCFGAGESTIEAMLPNLIERGRDPSVGITASNATISLRIATRGRSIEACRLKMQPTIDLIRASLQDLIFGENDESLEDVVARKLADRKLSLALFDFGLAGQVSQWLERTRDIQGRLQNFSLDSLKSIDSLGSIGLQDVPGSCKTSPAAMLDAAAEIESVVRQIRQVAQADLAVVVGRIDRDEAKITSGESYFHLALSSPQVNANSVELVRLQYWGHSAWREERAIKQVLNQIRLHLEKMWANPA